jgi:simple sugar transport system substrate-binding protein
MEQGVKEYNQKNGTDIYYGGSTDGSGQAAYVESLLSQNYDAICVVPFDTEALQPILEKAKAAGITVITHEAASYTGTGCMDYDIEAFDNTAYGEHFAKMIGDKNPKAKVLQCVGALTSASHNEWCDGAVAYAKTNYPDMTFVADRIESSDDQDTAYNKVKEALTADPTITAIEGSAMGDIAGAARAVEELGMAGKVELVGTSLVSVSGKYVTDGTIDTISFWDPALAGQAMIELATAVLDGKANDSLSLDVKGYDKLTLKKDVYYANAWIDVNKDNVTDDAYNF